MPTDYNISPRHKKSDPGHSANAVDVFEDQTRGWILDYAKRLASDQNDVHQSIAVLMLATSYFEPIECFRSGQDSRGKSKEFFCRTVNRLFPELSEPAQSAACEILYDDLRCGLYHTGVIRHGVALERTGPPIRMTANNQILFINAWAFLDRVCDDFDRYLVALRTTDDPGTLHLREQFDAYWQKRVASSAGNWTAEFTALTTNVQG